MFCSLFLCLVGAQVFVFGVRRCVWDCVFGFIGGWGCFLFCGVYFGGRVCVVGGVYVGCGVVVCWRGAVG